MNSNCFKKKKAEIYYLEDFMYLICNKQLK